MDPSVRVDRVALSPCLQPRDTLFSFLSSRKKKTDKFLRDAVETRLRMLIPYIQHWPRVHGPPTSRPQGDSVFMFMILSTFTRKVWHNVQKLACWSPQTQGCAVHWYSKCQIESQREGLLSRLCLSSWRCERPGPRSRPGGLLVA